MEEKDLMELFHDVLEASILFLYDKLHLKYFDLFFETADNILAGDVLTNLEDEDTKALEAIYEPLFNLDLNVEQIRKALQAIILRGFKEQQINNGSMTPDTIGMIFAYLISKFEPVKRKVKILDPVAGVGNLLFTIINHLELDIEAFAVEHNQLYVQILERFSNLMNQPLDIHFQNTLNTYFSDMDFIVADFDYNEDKDTYFPYACIRHHLNSLKDEGVFIALIPNDFFEHDKDQTFKKELNETSSLIGLIELPDEMFKTERKSIIIIQKKQYEDKKCLMVKLPSFSDAKSFNQALMQIETWFETNKINKK